LGILNAILSFIVMCFTIISRAPLIKRHLVRIRRESLGPGRGLGDFVPTLTIALMLLAMIAIVYIRFPEMVPGLLIAAGCIVVISMLRALRIMYTVPVSTASINLCWLLDCLSNTRILWQLLYFGFSMQGWLVHPVGYTALLFDICMMSPTLKNVSPAGPAGRLCCTVPCHFHSVADRGYCLRAHAGAQIYRVSCTAAWHDGMGDKFDYMPLTLNYSFFMRPSKSHLWLCRLSSSYASSMFSAFSASCTSGCMRVCGGGGRRNAC